MCMICICCIAKLVASTVVSCNLRKPWFPHDIAMHILLNNYTNHIFWGTIVCYSFLILQTSFGSFLGIFPCDPLSLMPGGWPRHML